MQESTRTSRRKSANPRKRLTGRSERWTLEEKKKLFSGLKRYGPVKVDQIQRTYLPDRSITQIQYVLSNLRTKGKRLIEKQKPQDVPPIEVWIGESELLTRDEQDYSFLLGEVFSMFANLEPHDTLRFSKPPDYSAIYDYFAKLLKNEKTPKLKNIDLEIVIELIESLEEEIKTLDTASQERLLRLKHQLLTAPTVLENRQLSNQRLRQALGGDGSAEGSPSLNSQQPSTPVTPVARFVNINQSQTASSSAVSQSQPATSTTVHQSQPSTPSILIQSPAATSSSLNQSQTPTPSIVNQSGLTSTPSQTLSGGASGDSRPQKTPLYTLNPLCIPVSHLPLKQLPVAPR